ncbi:hypothetical protein C8P66_108115 [Humitalea rosea]|uniref:Uncharacterized protein n=1 Tax=Humitalea rosea TaxID=990373 RepID=A0A2W7J584_9PROT|nr:hypothetical protein [Humitalea rosea]PZW46836.1 hypothetical protein C8P66_108115 [Humitalea rosea]
MADAPLATIVHALPGRLRLRLPALRGDIAGLSALALAVAALPGVAAAEASATTGSLLIQHEGTTEAVLVLAEGLFSARPDAAEEAIQLPEALLPAMGAMAAAGLTIVQLLRREALPPALTLGWYAMRLGQDALRRRGS